jgi:hypothetical protein
MLRPALVAALLILGFGCQKASDSANAKRMPQPPPAPRTQPSSTLTVAVQIDGRVAPPLTAARLDATPPDFHDPERRAWKLSTLLGDAVGPDTQIVVTGDSTASLLMRQPANPTDPQPVLMLNRRGELIATVASPQQPFPSYHGEGGRLRRPGDATPHLAGVTAIKVVPKR